RGEAGPRPGPEGHRPAHQANRRAGQAQGRRAPEGLSRAPARRRRAPGGAPVSMTVAALIVAAGRGTRMGSPTPKAFLPLGGVPILARAVAAFSAHPRIGLVVAVVSDLDAARRALGEAAARVVLVAGGPERQDSVRLGLAAVGEVSLVLVHDAARPLVPRRVVDAVLEAAARHG